MTTAQQPLTIPALRAMYREGILFGVLHQPGDPGRIHYAIDRLLARHAELSAIANRTDEDGLEMADCITIGNYLNGCLTPAPR
jgi:hypothetical protein